MSPTYPNNTQIRYNSQVIPGDLVRGWTLTNPDSWATSYLSYWHVSSDRNCNPTPAKPFSRPCNSYPIMNLARLSHLHNYFKQVFCLKADTGFLNWQDLSHPCLTLSALTFLPFKMAQNSAYFWLEFDVLYFSIFLSKETTFSKQRILFQRRNTFNFYQCPVQDDTRIQVFIN